jgi:hypothetical protein
VLSHDIWKLLVMHRTPLELMWAWFVVAQKRERLQVPEPSKANENFRKAEDHDRDS